MLTETNGAIYENQSSTVATIATFSGGNSHSGTTISNCAPDYQYGGSGGAGITSGTLYWNSYPVYVCLDKTKKAIEVLKCLESQKLLKIASVPKFIEMVEKISAIL